MIEGKMKELTDKLEEKKIDLKGDVLKSYQRMQNWKKILISYNKVRY